LKTDLCEKCNGTGWILSERNGEEFASRCQCQKQDWILSRGEKANIPLRFLGAELDWVYQPDPKNPSQKKAKEIVKKFIKEYPAVDEGLLLQGSIGLGKTSLLCCIGYELIQKKNAYVYYIDWNDLVREMKTGEDHSSRDFNAIHNLMNRLITVDLLLFDEIGASKVSPWVYDNIYFVINKRYNNKRITICATNFYDAPSNGNESLTQRIGDRIRSRLYEMTKIVEINGIDFRQQNLRGE
jgi:DNA replication protein DnaC